MHLGDFRFHRPRSLREACDLGRALGPEARYLAGGTDLLVDLRRRRIGATDLVALDAVPELSGLRLDGDLLRIGARTTMAEIAASPVVREHAAALAEAARAMGNAQIRNLATIGGNFAAAVACAETPPACIVAGGRVRLEGPQGERILDAEDFFTGPRATVLAPGEVLVELLVPAAAEGRGSAYHRFSRRRYGSLALAGAAAQVALEDGRIRAARIALTAVAPKPLLCEKAAAALVGAVYSDERLREAAHLAALEARPISDVRASADYRRDVVETLARRALEDAVARARS